MKKSLILLLLASSPSAFAIDYGKLACELSVTDSYFEVIKATKPINGDYAQSIDLLKVEFNYYHTTQNKYVSSWQYLRKTDGAFTFNNDGSGIHVPKFTKTWLMQDWYATKLKVYDDNQSLLGIYKCSVSY
jgi:hypothetical protein